MNYDEEAFGILVSSPHDEVVKILKRHGIRKVPGRGMVFEGVRQYLFTQDYTGKEFLVNFKIGGDRALESIIVNLE